MALSKKTKIIIFIISIIVVGVSIGLIIYFTNKSASRPAPGPAPGPGPAPEKPNIGDPMAYDPPNRFGPINSQNDGNKPDITSNTISNINLNFILLICNIWFGENVNNKTWSDVNGVSCIQLQIVQNTTTYTYAFDITQIDVKNNIITFNAPTDFYLNSQQVWPLWISVNHGGKPVKVINY